ncbi:hypothetical protein L6R52_13670 [Myxococcota bacterium]|nr:hypothetical protein [Myxococcota bacterium]
MRTRALLTTLSLLGSTPAFAAEPATGLANEPDAPTVGWAFETSLATTYVARGVPQYGTREVPSSQTSLAFSIDDVLPGTLSLGVWNATALWALDEQPGTAVQLDFSASYSTPLVLEQLSLTLGFLSTLCPVQPDPAAPIDPNYEAIVGLAWDGEWLQPSVVLNGQLLRQQGIYAAFAVRRDLEAGPLTFSPGVNLGLAAYRHYAGGEPSAPLHVNDLTVSLDAKLSLVEGAYVVVKGAYALRGTPVLLMPSDTEARGIGYASIAVGLSR